MFDRMTADSKELLLQARAEATAAGYRPIGATHLFLAFFAQPDSVALHALIDVGLTRERAISTLSMIGGESTDGLAFTEQGTILIRAARAEADALSSSNIGPEHFLLGLLRQSETPLGRMLLDNGLTIESVRDRIRQG